MIRPRVMKKQGKKGNEHFYRFELVGDGLVETDNICFTWAESLNHLKEKVNHMIEQFKERQLEVLHAKFKNGIKS